MSARAEPVPPRRGPVRRAAAGLAGAITFLTIVPLPVAAAPQAELDLSGVLVWFPLVGAVVGLVAGLVRVGCDGLLGPLPSTVLAMAVWVVVSGALHQDALADTADGLGVRGDRARRLAVMRDSSTGAFGVLAVIGWAALVLAALAPLSGGHALRALVVAGAVGRLAALGHGLAAPPARGDGLGAGLRVRALPAALAALIAAAIAVGAVGPARAALSLAVGAGLAALTALGARRAVGGSTGDTLGAAVALAEAAVCLALLAAWR